MNLTLKYFGMLATITEKNEEVIETNQQVKLTTLCTLLERKYPALKKVNYKAAVNQSIEQQDKGLIENDEIALLPPFSGG